MLMFRNDTEKKTMTTMDEGKAGETAKVTFDEAQ